MAVPGRGPCHGWCFSRSWSWRHAGIWRTLEDSPIDSWACEHSLLLIRRLRLVRMSPAPLLQCFPLTSIPYSFVSIGSKSHRCSGWAGGLRLEDWFLLSWIRNFASFCRTFFIQLFLPRTLPRALRTELLVRALVTTGC